MEALTEPATRRSARLVSLTRALGGEALALGGLVADADEGSKRIDMALSSGAAAEVFGRMIVAQGGPHDFPERWRDRLPAAPVVAELRADRPGVIGRIDTRALGEVVVDLGGGRRREDDVIDVAVGVSHLVQLGTVVSEGQPLARVHAADTEDAETAAERVAHALQLVGGAVTPPSLVRETIR